MNTKATYIALAFCFTDHKPTLILSPEYCWAAPWCDHLHRRMVIAGKELVRN